MDAKRLKFLMDVDETIDKLSKDFPQEPMINKLKEKFFSLANKQFIKSAYQGIHELTVEDVIKKQASEFYKYFPQTIKNELVESFVEMEHQRRRDNFWEFCIQIYKQVECYTNHLFKSETLLLIIINKWQDKTFTNTSIKWDTQTNSYSSFEYKYGNVRYYEFLGYKKTNGSSFKKDDYKSHFENTSYSVIEDSKRFSYFQAKFKIVLYILFFDENVNEEIFKKNMDLFYEIQQSRNVIHGGKGSAINSSNNITNQDRISQQSYNNRYVNYLKYQGFLAEFMQRVSNSPNLSLI